MNEKQRFDNVRIPHDDSRTEVKVLCHDVQQLLFALLGRPVVEDGHRERMSHSDGVSHLRQVEQGRGSSDGGTYSRHAGSASTSAAPAAPTWTSTRLQRPAFTSDLATQRAA